MFDDAIRDIHGLYLGSIRHKHGRNTPVPAPTVDQLAQQVARVRSEPGLPYELGKSVSLADLRAASNQTRAALVAAVAAAPESAFESQPTGEDGEDVWSVGEIVGHCNGAALGIGGSALKLIGVEAGDPPAAVQSASEPQVMTRSRAQEAAEAVKFDDFYSLIPEDADLDAAETHDFFGTMSARSWLYFMSMHEAEHVAQIEALAS